MRYIALPQLENDFLNTGNNGEYIFRKIAVPVSGEDLTLEGVFCAPAHRSGYYHAVAHPKDRILLHFTAGHIRSDMSVLTRQDFHVSVPFVLARNGTIYQLYSSKYWSGNIGRGIGNINNEQDKRTIAIEISNYGFLTERDGNLETIYSRLKDQQGNEGPVDVYCPLSETTAYQKSNVPFRGKQYYATFTNEQYESLIVLLRYLTAQYNIPRQFLPESTRYTATEEVLSFRGIVSHVNYRETGKWDIGPAFDWERVIQGVQAATFTPAVTRSVIPALTTTEATIRSEEELIPLLPAAKGVEYENEAYEDIDSSVLLEAIHENGKAKKLYALLVGINDYREDIKLEAGVRFPKLRGCENDAAKVEAYLKAETAFEQHIERLTNEQATKKAIVKGFETHLAKAGKGDTILFYYSGHGTQELADEEVWTSDHDGRLECIACYYDDQTKDDFLLADKELRFLINRLAEKGAHVIMLFDCCHSGGNTRNSMFVQASFENVVEKRIPFSFKQRKWEDFIFSDTWSREQVLQKGEATALPEGLHVQIAACESDESAVEVNGEGVFTKALLDTLNAAKGDITYQAVRSRVRQYLRNIYEQKPRIYVVNGDQNLLYTVFLGQRVGGRNLAFGDVLYNKQSGWQLSIGAIHGIGENIRSIRILDPENDNKEYSGTIGVVKADITLLQVTQDETMDRSRVYKGYVENILNNSLRIKVNNVNGIPELQKTLMQQLTDPANNLIVTDGLDAQYNIYNRNGLLYITHSSEAFRPLVSPLKAEPESLPVLLSFLKQIAQWEHLKNLVNKQSGGNLTGNEIQVRITRLSAAEKIPIPIKNDTALIEYEKNAGKWKTRTEIELKNTTDTPLYCCALFLTDKFRVANNLLPQVVEYIEPGKTIKIQPNGNPVVSFYLTEDVEWYNWKEQLEYLKLIVSTDEFDAASLSMEALPAPKIPGTRSITRGWMGEPDTDTGDIGRWGTQTVILQQPNPEFDRVGEEKIKTMLEDEDTTDFALGIYFNGSADENFQPEFELKQAPEMHKAEKGFIGDTILNIANRLARGKRNKYYRETIKQFPQRIRIVSEGDSWFQHPLVLDIIDHLSRTYAIYCVAAAGDTLRNYQSAKKENGEYYLDALDREKPAFFLISGGGNDILGKKFRDFLHDTFDKSKAEGQEAKRFLKDSLYQELDVLANIYGTLFQQLQQSHPHLQIIVHGYDYPVKLNDAKKGWLGRYMIEKGIDRPGDRKAIIQLIMDAFNQRLKAVSATFNNVSYIDLRGAVYFNPADNVDQWYDEIHPDDEGFQQIAMKYIQLIAQKSGSLAKAKNTGTVKMD